jgi:ATP-dependent helicase/nuclease subunit A
MTAKSIEAELKRTARYQSEASDPAASVWVSANAGTGKTHVLATRVLRLMLAGTPPERILCLTYTKAAAAEMSKRVFAELAKWVMAPEQDLAATLHQLVGRAPAQGETARARTLFTAATETPGGLKVQTIHAFAERLLQRFPLEAGVTPGFAILDEEMARTLRREAIDAVLGLAARQRTSPLGQALEAAIVYAADDRFDEVLADALNYRSWLDAAARFATATHEGLHAVELLYRQHFNVRAGVTGGSIAADIAALLGDGELVRIRDILAGGSTNDRRLGDCVAGVLRATAPAARADALSDVFLKSDGEARTKFLTNALKAEHPDMEPLLQRAQARFVPLWAEMKGADAVRATMALMRLAEAVMQRYTDAKVRRAALDFADLIDKTCVLLGTAASAEWVLFKLDNGLDHILVDESQDTSPEQWEVVAALAAEFFSGAGARDVVRTVFAVGDEKQSIYSFQGAAPEMFGAMGDRFAVMTESAGVSWRRIPLNVSFRTVEPVLRAVDLAFADPLRTPGVESAPHIAKRFGQAGLVEIWPTETHEEVLPADAWSPLEDATAPAPVVRLANRIADTIQGWRSGKELLVSENRPIEPGDILILVRKRQPFAGPMVAALKARGIPVAGADRIRLSEQIGVEDLISLGDFLTLPEDDLALAEVLKSPLFNLDDDDLLALANGRKGTLWKALLDNASTKPLFSDAAATLKRWRKAADFTPPYEFFAALLDRDGVRRKLLSRLGPDAADPLDEFLNLALTYDDNAPPSLTGFLTSLREGTREIKRDMEHGRNEVRVMTVHGAKGLEAPIVFLPDTCSAGSAARQAGRPMKLASLARPDGMPDPFVWPVKGTSRLDAIRAARATLDDAEKKECNRLLYVAMTRARDRLYVAGFESKKGRDPGCWYELICNGLEGKLERGEAPGGLQVLRLSAPQTAAPEPPRLERAAEHGPAVMPRWAQAPAPRERELTIPLAPSRLAPYDTDETGEPSPAPRPPGETAEPAAPSPAVLAGDSRFLRGTLTHALLEHLPLLDAKSWPKAAKAFVAERGAALPARHRSSIVAETLAILNDATFAPLFGSRSRAEVPITGVIPRPTGAGPALRLNGQIDRLAELDDAVLIVDYKTNRLAPRDLAQVAPVYLYQLAAYRLAIAEIFKGKRVRAALLWTDGPRIMEVPSATLDSYAARLWDLDPDSLDA